MTKPRLLSIALLLLTSIFLNAQTGIIKGRVVDTDNLSMPGAIVFITCVNKGSITDAYGFYTLTGIPEGTHEVTVTYIGFNQNTKAVKVMAGQTAEMDFVLNAGVELSEVVVTGQLQGQSKALNTQMNKGNITNIISSDQVGRFPDANIGDALKRIPGINVQYDQGESQIREHQGNSTPIQFNHGEWRKNSIGRSRNQNGPVGFGSRRYGPIH